MIRELSVLLLAVIVCFQQTKSVELSTIASHPCDPNPCQNGGKCSPDASAYGYYCTCPNGVYGYQCDKQRCPPRFWYQANSGTCIRLVFETRSWYEARKRCHEFQGSYLTIVNNEAEAKDQTALLKSYAADITIKCKDRVWIGAQTDDLTCKTPYMWKPNDDDYLPLHYSNWYKGQPDCWGNNSNCISATPGYNFQWSDTNCGGEYCFICEIGPYE